MGIILHVVTVVIAGFIASMLVRLSFRAEGILKRWEDRWRGR